MIFTGTDAKQTTIDRINVKLGKEKCKVKQEKLCEIEDMMPEELGVENVEWEPGMKIEKFANDREIGGTHYKDMDIQPWDIIDQGDREQAIGFYRYNALKYIMRAGSKGEFKEDIAKAEHYLQKLLEIL